MKAVFCESHHIFELVVETVSENWNIVTLNEQNAGPHHPASGRLGSQYIHAGPVEECKLCQ